jgi:VWFA-related protein
VGAGLALACGALAEILWAQGPAPVGQAPAAGGQAPTIKVQVEQVLVPVVATDRKGHFIPDLKAADFHVFEDGVEQKLVALYTEATGAVELFPAESGAEAHRVVPQSESSGKSLPRHTYLIALDARFSALANFTRVREALEKLFAEDQGSDSQYALVAVGEPMRIIQNLTRDPQAILAALGNKDLTKSISSSEASNMARQESEMVSRLSIACRTVCRDYCQGEEPDTQCSMELDRLLASANAAAQERWWAARSFVNDLRGLTEQLSRMAGRRVLILTSDGFNFQPGRELFQLLAYATHHSELAFKDEADSLQEEIERIAKLASAGNVIFYTVDSRGLYAIPAGGFASQRTTVVDVPRVESTVQPLAREKQDAMNYLATATGGISYQNQNDLLRCLRQSFADGREYYVLAYVPTNRTHDGNFRRIRVEVRSKGSRVRAKSGYWAPVGDPPASSAPARE